MKNINSVTTAKAGISLSFLRGIPAFAGMTLSVLLLIGNPAFAEPYKYAPEGCDFQVTFPEKPFIEQKCTGEKKDQCFDVLTYTQMKDASSLNFRITCMKEDEKTLKSYTPDELKSTLEQMTKDAGLNMFAQDSALTDNGTRTAVALATGRRNDRDVIYTGQIWIGKNSLLNLEGEMQGPQNATIDQAYSDILKSVKDKNAPPEKSVEKRATIKAEPKKTETKKQP